MTPIPADGRCRICHMSRVSYGVTFWPEPGTRASTPLALLDAVLWVCGWPACESEARARARRAAQEHGAPRLPVTRIYTARPIPEVTP